MGRNALDRAESLDRLRRRGGALLGPERQRRTRAVLCVVDADVHLVHPGLGTCIGLQPSYLVITRIELG